MLSTWFLFSYADVMQQGWAVDPASRMLIVKRQPTEQKLDPNKLQRLTEYVLHLEH
jgi:COP9 signalosome complex subunit 8